jgi:hypothetical protein
MRATKAPQILVLRLRQSLTLFSWPWLARWAMYDCGCFFGRMPHLKPALRKKSLVPHVCPPTNLESPNPRPATERVTPYSLLPVSLFSDH